MNVFLRRLQVLLITAVVGLGWSATATAHQTAVSTMKVEVRPGERAVEMLLTMEPTDLTHHLEIDPNGDGFLDQEELAEVKPALAEYVTQRLEVVNDGERCDVLESGAVETPRREPTVSFHKNVECERPLGTVAISNQVLFDVEGGYTHYAQLQIGDDIHTTVFKPGSATYELEVEPVGGDERSEAGAAPQSVWDVAAKFVWQGIIHIVLGLDHVLFVLCLLLAAREFKRLIGVVTAFTVAHSVTLALSSLEIVAVPADVIEPLIALSIVWVATEIILGREPEEYLYLMTFVFGLLHGFGFSYVLRDVGLPPDALASALFSFNVGVELGQIAIVVLAFPLISWVEERDWGAMAFRVMGGAVLAVAVYWLVARTIAALSL